MSQSTKKRKKSAVPLGPSLERLDLRHRALLSDLADIGLVLRGSIARRMVRCGQPTCCCKASPPRLHAPYYLWTRKLAGKTVTAQLTPEHAARCQVWSHNMRKLDRIVRELQAIGLKAAAAVRRP